MVDQGSGRGDALAPEVQVIEQGDIAVISADELSDNAAKAHAEALDLAQRAVAGCEAKIEKIQGHLDGAKQSLAEAQAHLAAVESEA